MAPDMSDPVLVERRGETAIVILNAPEKRNALSTKMRVGLRDRLVELGLDRQCRAIILTGAAGQFCAGGDISEMVPAGADPTLATYRLHILHDAVRAIARGPKPVIAAVEGAAAGAGFSLAMACDYVVAAKTARFIAAFVKLGLVADCGLQFSLTQRVGPAEARRILLGAETVEAEHGAKIGLVDVLAVPGGAVESALAIAAGLAEAPPLAIAATKLAFSRGPASLEEALALESDLQVRLAGTQDHEEAKAAFIGRRKPTFTGA
jgi:2-(1,2-epoxy-1,2-dihydrophenyl)acetyl-CoA isomerase